MRNGYVLKSRVKRICVNQGVGAYGYKDMHCCTLTQTHPTQMVARMATFKPFQFFKTDQKDHNDLKYYKDLKAGLSIK